MSNSSLVNVKVPAYAGNYTKGRSGYKISMIAMHHMAGKLTAKQCGAIFQRKGRNGSANYGIGYNGEIGLYVDECNTAWANSNWVSNCKSVSIEVSNDSTGGNWHVSDKSLNSLIKLVADIAKRNKLGTLVRGKNFVWHSMYTSTACPGQYLLSKIDYIIAEANKINNPPKPTPKPTTEFKVRVDKKEANVRKQPNTNSALAGSKVLYKGDVFVAVGTVKGENVKGNDIWYKSKKGNYVWSGGLKRI